MSEAKFHHYVPRFLLSKWATGTRGHVHAFDKSNNKTFATKPENVGGEMRFYEHVIGGTKVSLEKRLAGIEGEVAATIKEIVEKRMIILSNRKRSALSLFAATQFNRSPAWRAVVKDANEKMTAKIASLFKFDNEARTELNEETDSKLMTMKMTIECEEIAALIHAKDWVLFRDDESNLYISDSPVVLHNDTPSNLYGTLGFGLKGIQIYLPLSPGLILGFICPSIFEGMRKFARLTEWQARSVFGEKSVLVVRRAKSWQASLDGVGQVPLSSEHVVHMNSLQVRFSRRFIYSHKNDFDLVKKMTAAKTSYRGPSYFSV